MVEEFEDGDSLLSIRKKLNSYARELNLIPETYETIQNSIATKKQLDALNQTFQGSWLKESMINRTFDGILFVETKTGKLGPSSAGTYSRTGFIAVSPGQKIYFSGVLFGRTDIPTGVAGYRTDNESSFNSTLDSDGIEIGALFDNRRYAVKLGVPVTELQTPIYHNDVEITIPTDGSINFIKASSAKYTNNKNVRIEKLQAGDILGQKYFNLADSVALGVVNNVVTGSLDTNVVSSPDYHTSDFIPVKGGQVVYVTCRIGGTVNQGLFPSGITGYSDRNVNTFVSTKDASGLPIGNVFSLDRYAYNNGKVVGQTIENKRTTFNRYRVVIPNGVNYIVGSSAYTDGISLAINTKYETQTVQQAIKDLQYGLSNKNGMTSRMKIISHRGISLNGVAPENSLDAYKLSARAGYKFVEVDFNPTLDGHLVVIHDDTLARTFMNKNPYTPITETLIVKDMTLADLRANYVLKSDNFRHRRPIPTLEDFLAVCRDYNLYPMLEIKEGGTLDVHVYDAYMLAVRYLGKKGFCFSSFSTVLLDFARGLDPDLELYYTDVTDVDYVKSKNGNIYMRYTNITNEIIANCRAKGVKISAWTVPAAEGDKMLKMGLDEVLTNNIAPNINSQTIFFSDYSDKEFANYTSTGIIDRLEGVARLRDKQTLTLISPRFYALPFGAIYLNLDIIGSVKIDMNGLSVAVNNTYDDYKMYSYQILITENVPSLVITGVGSGGVVKDVQVCISEF